jgi:hypothetical protein
MTTLTIKVPDGKAKELSAYAKEIGGEIVAKDKNAKTSLNEEDEVTHGVFFGENIIRVIKAFGKK